MMHRRHRTAPRHTKRSSRATRGRHTRGKAAAAPPVPNSPPEPTDDDEPVAGQSPWQVVCGTFERLFLEENITVADELFAQHGSVQGRECSLSPPQFLAALRDLGLPVSDELGLALFSKYDRNDKGHITMADCLAVVEDRPMTPIEASPRDMEPQPSIPRDTRTVPAPKDPCYVCKESLALAGRSVARLVECGHIFHTECIKDWYARGNDVCPWGCTTEEEELHESHPPVPSHDGHESHPPVPSHDGQTAHPQRHLAHQHDLRDPYNEAEARPTTNHRTPLRHRNRRELTAPPQRMMPTPTHDENDLPTSRTRSMHETRAKMKGVAPHQQGFGLARYGGAIDFPQSQGATSVAEKPHAGSRASSRSTRDPPQYAAGVASGAPQMQYGRRHTLRRETLPSTQDTAASRFYAYDTESNYGDLSSEYGDMARQRKSPMSSPRRVRQPRVPPQHAAGRPSAQAAHNVLRDSDQMKDALSTGKMRPEDVYGKERVGKRQPAPNPYAQYVAQEEEEEEEAPVPRRRFDDDNVEERAPSEPSPRYEDMASQEQEPLYDEYEPEEPRYEAEEVPVRGIPAVSLDARPAARPAPRAQPRARRAKVPKSRRMGAVANANPAPRRVARVTPVSSSAVQSRRRNIRPSPTAPRVAQIVPPRGRMAKRGAQQRKTRIATRTRPPLTGYRGPVVRSFAASEERSST